MNIDKLFSKAITFHVLSYQSYAGLSNMAIDHHLASSYIKDSIPLIRFYGWQPFCISLGIHQKELIINYSRLRKHGYQLVRRPTGGRAILHANELTYSMIIPRKSIHHRDLYHFFHLVIVRALNSLGFHVFINNQNNSIPVIKNDGMDSLCFTSFAKTEIQYYGKKVVGSAQKIYQNAILQHGSILIDDTHKKIIDFLNISPENMRKLMNELNDKTISLKEIKKDTPSPEIMAGTILKQLEKVKNISLIKGYLSEQDIQTAIKRYPF